MPNARSIFIERINGLDSTLNDTSLNSALLDKSTAFVQHNTSAKLLRNGIAVIGFVFLEDFIKSRIKEVLSELPTYYIAFNDLPDLLRYRTTVGSLRSIMNLLKYEETRQDQIAYVQNNAAKIGSTMNTSYDLVEVAFGHNNSNINSAEIAETLKAFNIPDAWNQMNTVSNTIGLSTLSLKVSFDNAAIRRHKAAHDATANTPNMDLSQYVKDALAIALSFDSLLCNAIQKFKLHDRNFLNGTIAINSSSVNISKIYKDGRNWKMKKLSSTRSLKNDPDFNVVKAFALSKSASDKETLLIYNENNKLVEWINNF